MLQMLWAQVQGGQIKLAEQAELPEGARLLITVLQDDENQFWLEASAASLTPIWDNAEDDVYAQLLKE